MEPLQIAGQLSISALFLVGLIGGVVATLAMDFVMARIDEGATPPKIASGVLTESHPDVAPRRLASVVHYVAGALTGPLFVWLTLVSTGVLGTGVVAVVLAAVVCYPLMVGFFALVVLPRAKGMSRQRLQSIRRAWSVEAAVYLVVLAPVVGIAALIL